MNPSTQASLSFGYASLIPEGVAPEWGSSRTGHVAIGLGPLEHKPCCVSEQGSPRTRQCLPFLPIFEALLGIRPNPGSSYKARVLE